MPPLPRLKLPAIQELERQLRYVPPATLRRQIERIESLCAEIADPAARTQAFPEDWLIYRITGYRPDADPRPLGRAASPSPTLLIAHELVGDLAVLVERLCDVVAYTETDLHRASNASTSAVDSTPMWLDAPALCARWKISRKTLDRYRRDGLTARRVRTPAGKVRLFFARAHIEQFESRHSVRLADARDFSRIDSDLERKMVRLASRYHARLGWSPNRIAHRLAQRFDRSHEAVRLLLRRSALKEPDTVPAATSFVGPPPLSERPIRVIARAYARGIEVARLAEHFHKTRPAIYRALLVHRAERLRGLDFGAYAEVDRSIDSAARSGPTSASKLLDHPIARFVAGPAVPSEPVRTLADLLACAGTMTPVDPATERAAALTYVYLIHRARTGIGRLSAHHPAAAALDRVETDLRWASMIKYRLVLWHMPLVIKSIRAHIGIDLVELPRAHAKRLLDDSIRALVDAIDRHDPARGGRLAAPLGLAIARATSASDRAASDVPNAEPAASRARRFVSPDQVILADWSSRLTPWQTFLDPPAHAASRLEQLPHPANRLLALRYGLAILRADPSAEPGDELRRPRPPITLIEAAKSLGMTPHHAAALERSTLVSLRRSPT